MENKLKKEELFKVIAQMEVIQKLPKTLLEELCKVFKVEEVNTHQNHLIQQFKNKMVDIFIQEADGYMDYLQLPKFRTLGADSTQKMYSLFSSVWKEYAAYIARQQTLQTKKEIQEITPTFESFEKMEQFHLRLLQIYRDSSICPKTPRSAIKQPQESNPIPPPEINGFLFPNPPINAAAITNGVNSLLAPHYPFSQFNQTPNFPKVEAQEGNPYIIDNKQPPNAPNMMQTPPIYDMPRFNMQAHPHPPFFSPIPDLYQQIRPNNEKPQDGQMKYLFKEPFSTTTDLFINYEFIQCVCEGRKGHEDKNIFQCAFCNFSYHLNCIRFDMVPSGGPICPLCKLRKETIFCKVTHEPMKFNWYLSQRGRELKVEFTEDQSHQIYQAHKNGLDCQIRFLKINGRSTRRDKRSEFTSCNGYLQKANKHTEITLPQLSEDRHQPISIEIVLRSEDDNTDPNLTKLYLFAVFLIKIKKVDQVVTDLFSSKNFVTLDYYHEFMGTEGRVIVDLTETYGYKQIKYPVRGDQCRHAGVFDLKNFLQMIKELKKDNEMEINCPLCSIPCSYFNYDRQIYNAIQNFPEYDEKKPQGISIEINGDFFWVGNDGNNQNGSKSEPIQAQEDIMDEQRDNEAI